MELPEYLKILKDHGHIRLVTNLFIQLVLEEYLTKQVIDPMDFDLNPHLTIQFVCQEAVKQVVAAGLTCTPEEVMLMWLTFTVYDGKLLPPYKEE